MMEWSQLESQSLPSLTEAITATTTTTTTAGGASLSYYKNNHANPLALMDESAFNEYHGGETTVPFTPTTFTTPTITPTTSAATTASTTTTCSWLEQRLAQHERALVQRCMEESARDRQRLAHDVWQRRHVQAVWQQDREQWLSHVMGTHYVVGNLNGRVDVNVQRVTTETPPPPPPPIRNQLVRRSLPGETITKTKSCDPSIVAAHVDIVRSMRCSPPLSPSRASSSISSSSLLTTMDAFYQLARSLSSSSSSSSSNNARAWAGYAVAWQWAVPLVHAVQTTPSSSSSSSSFRIDQKAIRITARARASLAHLCRQYRHVILQHVQAQARDGDTLARHHHHHHHHYQNNRDPIVEWCERVVLVPSRITSDDRA